MRRPPWRRRAICPRRVIPAPTPTATPPPGASVVPATPVLGPLKAPSGTPTVKLCRGARDCHAAPLKVTYRLDRAAAVTAQVQRRDGKGRYTTAATLRASARAGANTLTIGAHGATARLRAGTYRLRLVAGAAGATSRPRLLAFRVR